MISKEFRSIDHICFGHSFVLLTLVRVFFFGQILIFMIVYKKVGNECFSVLLLDFADFVVDFGGKFYFVLVFDMNIKSWKAEIHFLTFAKVDLFGLFQALILVLDLQVFFLLMIGELDGFWHVGLIEVNFQNFYYKEKDFTQFKIKQQQKSSQFAEGFEFDRKRSFVRLKEIQTIERNQFYQ